MDPPTLRTWLRPWTWCSYRRELRSVRQRDVGAGERARHRSEGDRRRCRSEAVRRRRGGGDVLHAAQLTLAVRVGELHHEARRRALCPAATANKVTRIVYSRTLTDRSRHTATGTHVPYGITQCHLPPGRSDIPAFTPAEAGTRLSDPGGIQG